MTVFFSRLSVDRTEVLSEHAADLPLGEPYATHQWLWGLFSDGAGRRRDFLYRIGDGPGTPVIHAVSVRPPKDPGLPWRLETKPYAPHIDAGMGLGFSLRANPVVARGNGGPGRSKRHDVVMDAKRAWREKTGAAPKGVDLQEVIHEASVDWLARKGGQHGFAIRPGGARVDAYRVIQFTKGADTVPVRLGAVDFSGALEVTDATAFTLALADGIGPAKGFGFGLMMVRRL